jgi:isoaspartyl peptidase/L-asparaginase-like protein (Ntn-hydrolase superfamily)
MEQGRSPITAGRLALRRLRKRIKGHAGAIILSHTGSFALLHTTRSMAAGYQTGRSGKISGRYQGVK